MPVRKDWRGGWERFHLLMDTLCLFSWLMEPRIAVRELSENGVINKTSSIR